MGATSYDEKIDVTRDAGVTGSDGGWVASWASHIADLPCKIQWSTGQEVVIRDRVTSRWDAMIFCAIRDITVKDRMQYDSELYDIVSAIKPANKFMKIALKRNTEEALV